jgi:hypothetical protein
VVALTVFSLRLEVARARALEGFQVEDRNVDYELVRERAVRVQDDLGPLPFSSACECETKGTEGFNL